MFFSFFTPGLYLFVLLICSGVVLLETQSLRFIRSEHFNLFSFVFCLLFLPLKHLCWLDFFILSSIFLYLFAISPAPVK